MCVCGGGAFAGHTAFLQLVFLRTKESICKSFCIKKGDGFDECDDDGDKWRAFWSQRRKQRWRRWGSRCPEAELVTTGYLRIPPPLLGRCSYKYHKYLRILLPLVGRYCYKYYKYLRILPPLLGRCSYKYHKYLKILLPLVERHCAVNIKTSKYF